MWRSSVALIIAVLLAGCEQLPSDDDQQSHMVETMSTVIVFASGPAEHDEYLRILGEKAVDQVLAVWPDWDGRLTIEEPADGDLNNLLGRSDDTFDQVAAVASTIDGSDDEDAPVRVYINPAVFDRLTRQGQQIVITHEATHVATGAATDDLPLWLAEGFADHVALRYTDLPLSRTAGELLALVRQDGPPAHLPTRRDFDSASPDFGAQYGAAWLACELIVDRGGEDALVDLYREVSSGTDVDTALRRHLGLEKTQFVALWSAHLEELATAVLAQSNS